MKTFNQLKPNDNLYIYNRLSKKISVYKVVTASLNSKSETLDIEFIDDTLEEGVISITMAGATKSRINLQSHIIFSTEPIQ